MIIETITKLFEASTNEVIRIYWNFVEFIRTLKNVSKSFGKHSAEERRNEKLSEGNRIKLNKWNVLEFCRII